MADPILTLGDLEPERPTVRIVHPVPDGPWQAFKARYFDVLLRVFPVRWRRERRLYALRIPDEFGMATVARIQSAQKEVMALQGQEADPAATERVEELLRQVTTEILEAPREVVDALSVSQHITLQLAFPAAVMGQMPANPPTENPSTSDGSSRGSPASTAPMTG